MRVDHIYPWISRVERGGCLLWEITRQDKGGLFSPSSFKQPYSCYNSSSILVYSRGFNLHSGPVTCFANQFLSPLCGALSVPFYSIKLIRMSRLVLLICILNPREARDQGRMKPFALRQVVSRELEQICIYIYILILTTYPLQAWHLFTNMWYLFSTLGVDRRVPVWADGIFSEPTASERIHSQWYRCNACNEAKPLTRGYGRLAALK